MEQIQFLYLIASGNNDSIYKVGISVDPNARLQQIKAAYGVPNAYIVETMDVGTRVEVFALEAALHAKLEAHRVDCYGGREFFRLSQSDLDWLRTLYRDNSNDFAQAKAYYGLEVSAAELSGKAKLLEQERQKQIRYNRTNGKTYDTRPSGDLKRYNKLQEQIRNGHLGERFKIKSNAHPSKALCDQVVQNANSIIANKNGLSFLKVCAVGLCCSAVVSTAKRAQITIPSLFSGGAVGFFAGTLSQAMRGSKERYKAKSLVESEVDARYPSMRDKTMVTLEDLKAGNSFLIMDYTESAPDLRNKQAVRPIVDLPSESKIYSVFEQKSYFPKLATVATAVISFGIG
jgi:hypothetical protein